MKFELSKLFVIFCQEHKGVKTEKGTILFVFVVIN